MRNKVILIKGNCNIGNQITIARHQRLDADRIALIIALRSAELLPLWMADSASPDEMLKHIRQIVQQWSDERPQHALGAEYAASVVERGAENLKVVEGESLHIGWYYETAKTIHRNLGCTIIEAEIQQSSTSIRIRLDGFDLTVKEFVEKFKPVSWLG